MLIANVSEMVIVNGMKSAGDILLCLLISLAAFGLVIYVRSRKV